MFAHAPLARTCALAGAVLVAGASPLKAADRNVGSLPQVDFTRATTVPTIAGIVNVPALAMTSDKSVDAPAPSPAAVPQMRPTDLRVPRVEGNGGTALRRSMYASFAALQIMDAVSTRKALSNGAREANPMMSGIAGNSAALFAVKAGTAAATTYLAERLAKNHPRRATIMMAVLNTAYAAIVAHNYRVAKR